MEINWVWDIEEIIRITMKKIILDTNFLTIPYQFGLDIFEEIKKIISDNFELVTLDGVINELENLAKNKGKDSRAAKIGLELIEKNQVKIIKTELENVDDSIVEISDEDTIVATNDKELKQRLKDKGVKVIYLRSKNSLELSN